MQSQFTRLLRRERSCATLPFDHSSPLTLDQHLTVSEARSFTGKSESTIKRMLREIVARPAHPDRAFILPPPEEVERRKAANEPYAWKIDRQLLLRRFPPEGAPEQGSGGVPDANAGSAHPELMLTILREQLASKDQQIRTLETQLDRKDEQIASLNERMRESNVLMRELQQRLAIAPPKGVGESLLHAPPVTTGGGGTSPSLSSAKHSKSKPIAVNSSAAKKKPVKPKPGFFTRFFGTAK